MDIELSPPKKPEATTDMKPMRKLKPLVEKKKETNSKNTFEDLKSVKNS